MKKVVFLDIDGVLQPGGRQFRFDHNLDELQKKFGEKNPEYLKMDKYDIGATYYDWDLEAVELLRNLLIMNEAKIVISSAWRTSKNLDQLKLLFNFYELDNYIIDATPILYLKGRAAEIQQFLDEHPEIEKFVILDDDSWSFKGVFTGTFVYCPNVFNRECFDKANKILNPE